MLLTPAFRNFDSALDEASRICGASRFTTLHAGRDPGATPAILVVLVMSLIRSFESFEIELFLGVPAGLLRLQHQDLRTDCARSAGTQRSRRACHCDPAANAAAAHSAAMDFDPAQLCDGWRPVGARTDPARALALADLRDAGRPDRLPWRRAAGDADPRQLR